MTKDAIVYGLGALVLGIVGLVCGDFALQWQPVPEAVPRMPFAYISALLLLAGGAAIFVPRTSAIAALALGSFYGLWVVFLKLPKVFANPAEVVAWLGFAEILTLTMAGVVAWAMSEAGAPRRPVIVQTVQLLFGGCLLVFGLSHFVYAEFTAKMIPGWMPFPLFWAYATGSGHIAAGLSLLFGVLTRLASTLLAAMMACFVILLHLPRVLADPASRIEWTMLGVAIALTGAAWIIRTAIVRLNDQARQHRAEPADMLRRA